MNDISTSASEYSSNISTMKSLLLKLYLHYSSIGERTKVDGLSQRSFLQLLKDCKMISITFSIESADLIVRKVLQKNKQFSFQTFCNIFVDLAEELYPDDFLTMRAECLIRLISNHIAPLYSTLLSQNLIINLEISLTPQLLLTLSSVKNFLQGLYKMYFPWELNSAQSNANLKKLSEKALFTLISKYKIYPEIITRGLFKVLWQNLTVCPPEFTMSIECAKYGKVWTIRLFISFLILAAEFGIFKLEVANINEKFVYLLENMEICSGRNEISGGSVIVSRSESYATSEKYLTGQEKDFKKVFSYLKYSGVTKEVTLKKIKDFFRVVEVDFKSNELELIFFAVCKNKGTASFEDFSEIFVRISSQLQLETDLIDFIFQSNWFQDFESKIAEEKSKISNSELSETLSLYKQTLFPCLKFYGSKGKISFPELVKFCTDFDLFPELFTKQLLDQVFYTFCLDSHSESLKISEILQVIEICAVQSFIPNLTNNEKLLSVLERIVHSEGHTKLSSKTGLNRNSELNNAGTKLIEEKKSQQVPLEKLNFDVLLNSPKKNLH